MASTKNFGDVIRAKIAANPDLAEAIKNESFNSDIAQKVYDLRMAARLSQKKLAELARTHQSVISRIEDADYDGHSLALLKRIADALGQDLWVEFYPRPVYSRADVEEFSLEWQADEWEVEVTC